MGGPHFMKIRKKRKLPETNLLIQFEINRKQILEFWINKYTFACFFSLHFFTL